MQWLQNLFRRGKPQIPASLWEDCIARLPFLHYLSDADLERLKALCETLLDKKSFIGAQGFQLDDETAVAIAAQACLPVLNLTLDLYDDMAGVIVYPSQFIIPQSEVDEAGVVHEWHEPASGEAVSHGGAVVLSWEDIHAVDGTGFNVVIHEFVHKIDMLDGTVNGRPPFLTGFHEALSAAEWQRIFTTAYDDFTARVAECEEQLPEDYDDERPEHAALYDKVFGDLPLDPYASRHPAEFFAVASEAFFVMPEPLAEDYPEVYGMLAKYYRQDPLAA
ncbi:zinc-dependent peptidase [Oxalobacteraceae bacterium OM1]|nr:zinc-dependent peptidase [Oxalobacteraceae bacterium OM1]